MLDFLDRARLRKLWMEDPEHGLRSPKRGDLVYTNVGKKLPVSKRSSSRRSARDVVSAVSKEEADIRRAR